MTLPARSRTPYGPTQSGYAAAGVGAWGPPSLVLQRQGSNVLPQGYCRASPPRAARSHSASVGSRPPAQAQKARASSQVTLEAGKASGVPHTGDFGGGWLDAARKRLYWPHVTSVVS